MFIVARLPRPAASVNSERRIGAVTRRAAQWTTAASPWR